MTYTLTGAPTVSLDPPAGTFATSSLGIEITWSDDGTLNSSSRVITWNGSMANDSFDYNGSGGSASSTGTMTLQPGLNTLTARICDTGGSCNAPVTAEYVLSSGDSQAPTASIRPPGGNYQSSSLNVTINWADNVALDSSSVEIRRNGSLISLPYNHISATSGQSTGEIALQQGTTVLTASIRDAAGHLSSTATASYTCCSEGPTVNIDPVSGVFATSSHFVTITWSDGGPFLSQLDTSSISIELNGSDVKSAFTYSGGSGSGSSTGTISLQAGSNSFDASICRQPSSEGCGSAQTSYFYDNVAPTISITPDGGGVSGDYVTVTINWADNHGLDGNSRTITYNNSDARTAFSYTPFDGGKQATSVGQLSVQAGNNVLVARICDTVNNCSLPDTVIFVQSSDAGAPTASISPTGGTFTSAGLPVTVTWNDDVGLDTTAAGREIKLNGSPATGFNFTPAGDTSATSSATITLQAGTNTLTARIRDLAGNWSALQSATYVYSTGQSSLAPVVDVASVNPGSTADRSLCMTFAYGVNAALECGDVRVVHPLPATLHLNKRHQPNLFYNTNQGHPYPYVQANVTLPAAASVPDSVTATLSVSGTVRASRKWAGSQWTPGAVRRIAIGYDAINDSTKVYDYTLEMKNWYAATSYATSATGQIAVVNRSNSYFGAGWWLAGLERLYPATMTWVGGDGSARKYTAVPGQSNVWAAPNVDQPDTIKLVSGNYVRYLKGGAQVFFDVQGQHIATRPRLGVTHQTDFTYTSGKLTGIYLRAPSAPYAVYTFEYNSLLYPWPSVIITAPPVGSETRITEIWLASYENSAVSLIKDPDGLTLTPSYWGKRIQSVTDRRGMTTSFDIDLTSYEYTAVRRGSPAVIDSILSIERQLLTQAADTSSLRVLVNGPRLAVDVSDTTAFYLDRFGAPRKIRNAEGDSTILLRGNSTYPALVTEVIHADGFREQATFNARANLTSRTRIDPLGTGSHATTRYEYQNASWPDFPTSVVAPMGDSIAMGYDTDGNRIWQQDARGTSSRTEFRYYTGEWQGLLRAVDPAGATPADSLVYDLFSAGAHGNLAALRSGGGFWRYFHKDGIGRDTLIVSPVDSATNSSRKLRQRFGYDLMDNVRWTETQGDTLNGAPAQTVRVDNEYDGLGNVKRVTRQQTPSDGINALVTNWAYDNLGRVVKEVAPDGQRDSTVYDPAGNVIQVITRRNHEITMAYDALNRLTERQTQGFLIPEWSNAGIPVWLANLVSLPAEFRGPYPRLGNGSGYPIVADTARFTYDKLGRMISANNRDAQVSRTYYPNGLPQTETQRIRTLAELSEGGNFTSHTYTLAYTYDLNGRRTVLRHPANLRPTLLFGIADTTRYEYHPYGDLSKVVDPLGNEYRFAFTPALQLDSLYLPRGVSEHLPTMMMGWLRLKWHATGAGS